MCVIAFSKKGVDAPTEQQIREMFMANPDGAGYAYEEGKKVKYKKGFMTVDALLKELEPLSQWKNKNLAIHFRIGTAGENDEHTCHPFPITTNYGEMRKTEGEGPVLFHNGVIAQGGMIDENSSDTQDFVVAFAPMLKKYNKSKARDKWMEKVVSGNRMLIMYGKDRYKLYGEWKQDGELLVSNLNYKVQKYAHYYYNGVSGYYEPAEEYQESFDEYWQRKDKQRKEEKKVADKLFDAVEKNQYVYVNDSELDAMLENCEEYGYELMWHKGRAYGYSFEAGCVWSEASLY